jgi:nitrogen fixation/metabolism regulation signal transduction histidine kinase
MTPAGVLPLSFEIEATNLAEACAGFAEGAKMAFEETMKELQEMRRQQASSIVIPEAGAASALGAGRTAARQDPVSLSELADVLLYLVRLADKLDVDLAAAARAKIARNAEKYPVEKSRGSSRKYDTL